MLTWGIAAGGGPYISVEIYRGPSTEVFIDPDSEIAARIIGFTVTDEDKRHWKSLLAPASTCAICYAA